MKFPYILGQNSMKLGLILNVIDPKIGGVLLLGDRGTGKSTSVRALQSFLPSTLELKRKTRRNSHGGSKPYFKLVRKSIPLVELPLGATEDRLCGTIHLEKAIQQGQKTFEPGLLAKANGGLLYVDEINLLDDHLIDLLLDSAASGWNTVEREGISLQHPANFILIGSGNPEEGELRPQLLDRFGLSINLKTPQSSKLRARIVEQLLSPAVSPSEENRLFERIELARKRKVKISKGFQQTISQICAELKIDGLRGDLVLTRASCAFAAWTQHSEVLPEHVKVVLPFCLNHRLRKDPLDPMDGSHQIQNVLDNLDF